MPGATIVANQSTGAGAGSPGVARNDLWQSCQIDLLDAAGGNTSWAWTLLSKPSGSAAVLSGAATAAASFTPDVPGTYRVQLLVNGGGPGNISIKVLRVRKDVSGNLVRRGWCLPAHGELAGEANYTGNTTDWDEPWRTIIEDLLIQANSVIAPAQFIFPGVAGIAKTQLTSPESVGCIVFNPAAMFAGNAEMTRAIKFSVVLQATAGMTAEVQLYNIDTGAVVTSSTLTTTATTPTRLTGTLTVGASPNVPNALQTYNVRLRISAGTPGPSDYAICSFAVFEVSYT